MKAAERRKAEPEAMIGRTLVAIEAAGLPGIYSECIDELAEWARRDRRADADSWITLVNSKAEEVIRRQWDEDGAWRRIREIVLGLDAAA